MKRFCLLLLVLIVAALPLTPLGYAENEVPFEISFGFVDYQQFSMYLTDGTYRCGTDFEAGEYYIMSLFGAEALFDVSKNPNDFTWTYDRVLRKVNVENGQYVMITYGAIMVPAAELDVSNWGKYGVYEVGKDIPSGEYVIRSLSDEYATDLLHIQGICGAYQITDEDPIHVPTNCALILTKQEYLMLEPGQFIVINNANLTLIATDEDISHYSNSPSTSHSDNEFFEIEPYIADLGRLTTDRKELPYYDTYNDCVIHINGIPGEIDYGLAILSKVAYCLESLTWTSKENEATFDDYLSVKRCIADYYGITDTYDYNATYFECRSNTFSRIICEYTDKGKVSITWVYDCGNYRREMLAGIAAIKSLTDILKNPSSLQVHDVSYAKDAYCTDWNDAIGIRIDYSAQNSFGGYNREYYYVWVKPTSYAIVESVISPEVMLRSLPFTSIKVSDVSAARKNLDLDATAYLVYDRPIDVLNDYVHYLDITLSEAGFRESEASNSQQTKYSLDKAMFLGEKCSVALQYRDNDGGTKPISLEITVPIIEHEFSYLKEKMVEELNGRIVEEDTSSFIMTVIEKQVQIEVDYGFSKSIQITLLETEE